MPSSRQSSFVPPLIRRRSRSCPSESAIEFEEFALFSRFRQTTAPGRYALGIGRDADADLGELAEQLTTDGSVAEPGVGDFLCGRLACRAGESKTERRIFRVLQGADDLRSFVFGRLAVRFGGGASGGLGDSRERGRSFKAGFLSSSRRSLISLTSVSAASATSIFGQGRPKSTHQYGRWSMSDTTMPTPMTP